MPPSASENSRWFAEEIQPHESKLRAWLRSRFPSIGDQDDLVQETYLKVLQARSSQALTQPKAYLFTTARNAALDRCRRARVVEFRSLADITPLSVPVDGTDVAEHSDHDLELSTLSEAIRSLPERCREILVLRKHEGLSHDQIAAQLGISKHTVNAQLTIAMVKCRSYFRERGVLKEVR